MLAIRKSGALFGGINFPDPGHRSLEYNGRAGWEAMHDESGSPPGI